ncbi:MAG TPA: hypothetical protein VMK66_17220 [Myxococcales bacterium]|nr:hypothetical protein [Myxococcales bacterium]
MSGRRSLLLRLLFFAALAGGLFLWSGRRKPRDLRLSIDLASVLPGEVTAVDVVVRRSGHALARHEVHYGPAGAPGTVEMLVHAPPGNAEVEVSLTYANGPPRLITSRISLSPDQPAALHAR